MAVSVIEGIPDEEEGGLEGWPFYLEQHLAQ